MSLQDLATVAPKWRQLADELDLIHDLLGGTGAMRRAGLKWLPKEQAETWEAWRQRLNRSVLFNGLNRSLDAMVGQIIGATITLEDADPALMDFSHNMDGQGSTLQSLAAKFAELLLRDGAAYLFVDAPDKGGLPYTVLVEAAHVLGIHYDQHQQPVMLRWREAVEDREAQFRFVRRDQIRIYEPGRYSVWREAEGTGRWSAVKEGDMGIAHIPLVASELTGAADRQVRPPLMDLAWLNLAHWQSASDQRHILHIARVPILFARGMNSLDGPVEIGPNRLIVADDPAADIKFIEHSGAAIEAGRQDLIDLEDKMAVLGLDLIREQPGHPTATAKRLEHASRNATLAMVRHKLKDGLEMVFKQAAMWLGLDEAAAGRIIIPEDSPILQRQQQEADLLLRARLAGEISRDHFLHEIERRGILASVQSEGSVKAETPAHTHS